VLSISSLGDHSSTHPPRQAGGIQDENRAFFGRGELWRDRWIRPFYDGGWLCAFLMITMMTYVVSEDCGLLCVGFLQSAMIIFLFSPFPSLLLVQLIALYSTLLHACMSNTNFHSPAYSSLPFLFHFFSFFCFFL
jgi:hypothetical protein